jgi:hypothetical protein
MLRLLIIFLLLSIFTNTSALAAGYSELETRHFAFFYQPTDARTARYLIGQAETVREKIIADLGGAFAEQTRVYIAGTRDDFQRLQPAGDNTPSWAVAVAYAGENLIILNSPGVLGVRQDILTTFRHELTHIVVGQAFRGAYVPRWLNEGLAMYEAAEWDLGRITHMSRAVLTDSLIPIQDLLTGFPDDYQQAILAYDQSFYLVAYLMTRNDREAFHKFIAEYSREKNMALALQRVYGLSISELEKEWRKHLRLRFSWLPLLSSATTLWFIITLIFLISYRKKRQENLQQLSDWEIQEDEPTLH